MLDDIEALVGSVRLATSSGLAGPSPERMKRLCHQTWTEAKPVAIGDEVDRYLRGRGINQGAYPRTLRFHPSLGYYEKQPGQKRSKLIASYAAMIACVQGPDGHAVTLHRTYLRDGRKALGDQSKKLLSAGINGAAVRLDEATDELALTEGIETALAVRLRTGKPTWAAINCGNLERIWIPEQVQRVCIYADNDSGRGVRWPGLGIHPRPAPRARSEEGRRPSHGRSLRTPTGGHGLGRHLARLACQGQARGVGFRGWQQCHPLFPCAPGGHSEREFPKWQLPGHAELQQR
ncbi:MAG: toprim domain-containing protein [Steroidobacteraceae bacterium]